MNDKITMREALIIIARDVERTEYKDLHKLRRLASRALNSYDQDEFVKRIHQIMSDPENSAADCYGLISEEFDEIGMHIVEHNLED